MLLTSDQSFSHLPYKIIKDKNGHYIKIYLNDCLTGMKHCVKDNSIDVVVTSPPYNIGKDYNTYKDDIPRSEYLSLLGQVGREIKRVLKDDGSFFLNIGNRPKDQWLAWDVANTIREDFTLQNVIHWIKSIAISKEETGKYPNIVNDIAVGHFKPIVSNRFLNNCQEYIFHFTKKGNKNLEKLSIGVPYQDKTNIERWNSVKDDKRDRGNTWFIPYETIQTRKQRPHPATFPIKLPEMCIKLHGLRPALVVMDPFLGIGSTAIASSKLGVSFIGFEIDRGYIDETIVRLSMIDTKTIKRLNYKFMRNLKEETNSNSMLSINFDAIYNEACDDIRPNTNDIYPKDDPELRSRVKEDLLLNKFIRTDENIQGNIFITEHGNTEFLKLPKDGSIY